jgi:hypothetical protein
MHQEAMLIRVVLVVRVQVEMVGVVRHVQMLLAQLRQQARKRALMCAMDKPKHPIELNSCAVRLSHLRVRRGVIMMMIILIDFKRL